MVNSSTMFADDANIFYAKKDPKELDLVRNIEIEKGLDYCIINKLSVNMKKTNYMLITPNTNKQIHINIHDIERKSCILDYEPEIIFIDE